MAYKSIAKIYANLVFAGVKNIDSVPDELKDDVQAIVEELKAKRAEELKDSEEE